MKVYKLFISIVLIISISSFFLSGVRRESVEKLAINSAIGYDLEENAQGIKIRSATASRYMVTENEVESMNVTSRGRTIPELREERQRKLDKKILLGLEKVYIISDEYARYGIKDIMDSFFRNPDVKDSTLLCICEGKAEDIMNTKLEGYPSAGDYIEGLIRYSRELNFFPDNYKLIDAYLRLDAEGRNLVLPYIKVEENTIVISGLALFKEDKMVGLLPMGRTKQHNVLRENNLMGLITIQENSDKYLGIYGKSKRKVKCYKENDKYRFVINLKITGDIITNEYEAMLINKPDKKKEAEDKLKANLEKELRAFLENLKSEYKVDTLELGRVAAAKYGRKTGVDWNEIVSNSEIDVNVTVKIAKFGRGDY
ncbi:Ger(x)C family spore germination protein [Clostridium swellfunianum]|uniref:Ger(x)C family spore germination protein n=1 Tax=Clostridium swellfunianum TaxID=1367462 RepID=UPI00202E1436|nr:Ger(x)C family spore germination protein [Clostridium swellfunianum]MCM0650198.1 Ger(x)C family spore germination protein [Clostridium swellfunianum]